MTRRLRAVRGSGMEGVEEMKTDSTHSRTVKSSALLVSDSSSCPGLSQTRQEVWFVIRPWKIFEPQR